MNSVNQLSKSLTEFTKEFKLIGFSNILSRYEEDLKNFALVLNEIEVNNGTMGPEILERIKIIEELFFEDETDLMNTESISTEQAEEAQTLVESLERTENLTETACRTIEEVIETEDTTSNSTLQTTTVGNTTESQDESQNISDSQDISTESVDDGISVTEGSSELDSEVTTEIEGSGASDRDFSGMAGFPLILFDL